MVNLCNVAFENCVVPRGCRRTVIVLLCKVKGERNECKNYIGIRLVSVVGKICAGVLGDRVCRMSERPTDGEQGVSGQEVSVV